MFDLIVAGSHGAKRRDLVPLAISWGVHALVIGGVVVLPLLFATNPLPDPPEQMVISVTLAPPPPPPPPPAAAAPDAKPAVPRPVTRPRTNPQPIEVLPLRQLPALVQAPLDEDADGAGERDNSDGVLGGITGGVPGGVFGGVVGGISSAPLPPPSPPPAPTPPPAAPAPRAPIRAGGQIQAPALIKQVPPVYPPIAVSAQIEGVVILEATVGRDGRVEEVEVLRSVRLLDKAAIDAVRQWEYAPLLLNGQAERFILTVTVSFSLSS
jgi:protein TonB